LAGKNLQKWDTADFAVAVNDVNTRCVVLENNKNMEKQVHCNLTVAAPAVACQILADTSGLAKERIKHAMVKGAVWFKRPGKKVLGFCKICCGMKTSPKSQFNSY